MAYDLLLFSLIQRGIGMTKASLLKLREGTPFILIKHE